MSKKKTLENTIKEWQPYIDIVNQYRVSNAIENAIRIYGRQSKKTRRIVIVLCTANWHPMNMFRGTGSYGLCEFLNWLDLSCNYCDLYEKDKNHDCNNSQSLFRKADDNILGADKLFWTLMEIYRELMQ